MQLVQELGSLAGMAKPCLTVVSRNADDEGREVADASLLDALDLTERLVCMVAFVDGIQDIVVAGFRS